AGKSARAVIVQPVYGSGRVISMVRRTRLAARFLGAVMGSVLQVGRGRRPGGTPPSWASRQSRERPDGNELDALRADRVVLEVGGDLVEVDALVLAVDDRGLVPLQGEVDLGRVERPAEDDRAGRLEAHEVLGPG